MFEAIEHACGCTIFRGRNAEGDEVFAWTADQLGMTVEPTGCHTVCSVDEARRQVHEFDLECEECCIDCGGHNIDEGQCLDCAAQDE